MKSPVDDEIIEKGKIVFDAYCEYKGVCLQSFFAELKDLLLADFLRDINSGYKLIKYNEKIFDYYTMVIDYYKSAVKAYISKRDKLTDKNIMKIADGIKDILECQINKYNESLDGQVNPISKEKEKIIDINMKLFSKDLLVIYEKIIDNASNLKIADYFEDIYKMYFLAVKNCFIQLNDINSRRTASYYYDCLKIEKEALSAIIKVQAYALEGMFESMEDEVIIQSMLMKLREGYQHISKHIADMEKEFKDVGDYENFIQKFDDTFKDDIISCFNNSYKRSENSIKYFQDCNKSFVQKLGNEYQEVANFENIMSEIEEVTFFAEKVISKFQYLYDYWLKNSDLYKNTDFNEIIVGIAETVNIKIQNIQEGIDDFSEKTEKILAEKKNVQGCGDLFLLFGDLDNSDDESYIDDKLSEVFRAYQVINDKFKKASLALKKDCILFEISTFEEIMHYSVSRMRNSQDVNIEDFVQTIDFVFDELIQVLSVIGVEVIEPKPHDLFNGKEHEVIMAEKNDDFKKGEVIKLMNSGYKEKDCVLMRANIIAAK